MADFDFSDNLSTYSTLSGWNVCPSSGNVSPETSISSRTMATEVSTAIHVPGGIPLNHLEDRLSGLSVGIFYKADSGPTRTWQASTRRFEPYVPRRARTTEQWSGEAGQSTSVLPYTPDGGLLTPQPTGGLTPETTADAEQDQTAIEGDESTGSNQPRKPYGSGTPRTSRKKEERGFRELCGLVKKWKHLVKAPTKIEALAATLDYIAMVRVAVYKHPRLGTRRERKRLPEVSTHAQRERESRTAERTLFEELSRYYRLGIDGGEDGSVGGGEDGDEDGEQWTTWRRPSLLKEVLEDLQVRYPPPELSTDE